MKTPYWKLLVAFSAQFGNASGGSTMIIIVFWNISTKSNDSRWPTSSTVTQYHHVVMFVNENRQIGEMANYRFRSWRTVYDIGICQWFLAGVVPPLKVYFRSSGGWFVYERDIEGSGKHSSSILCKKKNTTKQREIRIVV